MSIHKHFSGQRLDKKQVKVLKKYIFNICDYNNNILNIFESRRINFAHNLNGLVVRVCMCVFGWDRLPK